jgi:hypothetical protein
LTSDVECVIIQDETQPKIKSERKIMLFTIQSHLVLIGGLMLLIGLFGLFFWSIFHNSYSNNELPLTKLKKKIWKPVLYLMLAMSILGACLLLIGATSHAY